MNPLLVSRSDSNFGAGRVSPHPQISKAARSLSVSQ